MGGRPGLARRPAPETAPDPGLRALASDAIRHYVGTHAALFERAERLGEKADRLEEEGTPSESARNRAERARKEVEGGLAALRDYFSKNGAEAVADGEAPSGEERRRAFDVELERLYPAFKISGRPA